MNIDYRSIDPAWAWEPFSPDADRPWDRRWAEHLFRRATFGAGERQVREALNGTPRAVVHQLVHESSEPPELQQTFRDLRSAALASTSSRELSAWWLYRMVDSPAQLREKMTLFWHGHFATGADKVQEPRLMYRQNELFRTNALGRFSDLVHGISKDPAMLIYLDSVTNRKAHPNENYAREVMELFCLGEGHYTEKDVQELARTFTGWEIRNDRFRFNRYQHDFAEKTVLGRTGEFGGEEGLDIILARDDCPRFIVGKLMKFFLFDEPDPPAELIEPLARDFKQSGYEIAPLMERMLGSNLFFSEFSFARKIRSPLEFVLGILRGLESRANEYAVRDELDHLEQMPFYPPNVKGWDGGRTWINSSTLLARANLVRKIVDQKKDRFADGRIAALAQEYGFKSPEQIVDWMLDLLVPVPIPAPARADLIQLASQTQKQGDSLGEVVHALSTLPEMQLG